MTKSESALAKVQDLYVIQVELWNFLDSRELSPEQVAEAKQRLREFSSLLSKADWRLMGGEDVLQALQHIQSEVSAKLKKSPRNAKRGSLSGGKPVRRAAGRHGSPQAAAKPMKKSAAKKTKPAMKKKVAKKGGARKKRR